MSTPNDNKRQQLINKLKELFQLDQPDLDFGLYRIMHAKSAEITQFLEKDLLPQVQAAFALYKTADKAEIEKELAKVIAGIEAAGMDPSQSPKVKELQAKLQSEAVDVGGLEGEVYDHLLSFFRRYYSEGDFLSRRVYKAGVYAIPYEGEEVKLHWANADQYYIKTGEYLRDYVFRLRPEHDTAPMRVHLRLIDAAEGEHGNVKASEGNDRVFVLPTGGAAGENYIAEEQGESGNELVIRFEFRPATVADWPDDVREGKTKAPTQKDLIEHAVRRILSVDDTSLAAWLSELGKPHVLANGERANYTRIDSHLRRYTARNTFDYFIHKDLRGFLRRELDFYIKNEVMHLDDVEAESAARVEQYLSKIKVVRRVAGKVIDFLAQLEDFQKKLWVKKKFVAELRYLIAVGSIPSNYLQEVAANASQREEWVKQCAIDKLVGDLATPGFSVPLTVNFLEAHPTLLLDTRWFDSHFVERLLNDIEDLEDITDGILVHSDNFQALGLLSTRLRDKVKVVAIDPPYNRQGDGFPYKDNYKHSTWLTMMRDRLELARPLMRRDAAIFSNIDENERDSLQAILNEVFGANNRIEELIWAQNTTHSQSPLYSTNHEYIEVYAKDRAATENDPTMFREPKPGFAEMAALVAELNQTYPSISDIEDRIQKLFAAHIDEFIAVLEDQGLEYDEDTKKQDPWRGLYNYSHAEYRDVDGNLVPPERAKDELALIRVWREDNPSTSAQKQAGSTRDKDDPNFRFYTPAHPTTGLPCPHPKRGWLWPYSWPDTKRESFVSLDSQDKIVWGDDETKVPQVKRFLDEVETNVAKSFFHDYADGEKQIASLFGTTGLFPTPKPTTLPERFISQTCGDQALVLDFFAGSGTTGHAVINLNRADGGRRKFILVEASDYFDTVLAPRIKKVAFAPEWSEGAPKRLALPQEAKRSPRVVKVLRLESYEDSLNNLDIQRTNPQQSLLGAPAAQGPDGLAEQYFLRYMLEVETRGSRSLLNAQLFRSPDRYSLKVRCPDSDETRELNVDLLETFNWLIGLSVRHIALTRAFSSTFVRDAEMRLALGGRLKAEASGRWWFRTVTGALPDGRKVLVVWRRLTDKPEEDNLVLDEWFTRQGYSSKDSEFDLIYVNGGNNLENLKAPDDTWKVRLIEEDFHRLMFAMEGS